MEVAQPFRGSRISSVRASLPALRQLAAMPETAVVVSVERAQFAPGSVVRAITRGKIELRDSGGLASLPPAEFKGALPIWRIRVTDTLLIRRVA